MHSNVEVTPQTVVEVWIARPNPEMMGTEMMGTEAASGDDPSRAGWAFESPAEAGVPIRYTREYMLLWQDGKIKSSSISSAKTHFRKPCSDCTKDTVMRSTAKDALAVLDVRRALHPGPRE